MAPAPGGLRIRAARATDFPRLWEIRAASDAPDPLHPPPPGPVPPIFAHLLAHGTLLVAEGDEGIVGFGGTVDRSGMLFLTDLFVDPALQARGVGQVLLDALLPASRRWRCTLASEDPRAIASYARAGMTPRWPNYNLVADSAALAALPRRPQATLRPADLRDDDLQTMDHLTGGRFRPEDLAFFAEQHDADAFWVIHGQFQKGCAVVRRDAAAGPRADTLTIGPVGAITPSVARFGTLAAVAWARERAPRLEIAVPGPHPALPDLLRLGFWIDYTETYCASSATSITPSRYIGSGGDLF
ncbi:MAG: GNAT family N-acetyltransferase [Thermomicrobiales bacterium]